MLVQKRQNIIQEKSFRFALKTIGLVKALEKNHKEYVLSRQLMKSGTAIGTLVREAEHAESKKDFVHKMSVSLKEANETRYWLDLLYQAAYIKKTEYADFNDEIVQLIRILASIVKSSKL